MANSKQRQAKLFQHLALFLTLLILSTPALAGHDDGGGMFSSTIDMITGMSTNGGQSPYADLNIPGRIEAEDFDKGGEGVAYNDVTSEENKGGEYRDTQVDIQTADDKSGKYNIGWIRDQEWLEYTVDASSGTYDIKARVAAKYDGGKMRVKLDGETLGTYDIPETTGGWQSWQTITMKGVKISGGEQVLRLEMLDGGEFNINWIEFEGGDTTPPTGSITHSPSEPAGTDEVVYEASAQDDKSSISSIKVFVDGSQVKSCSGGSTCSFTGGPYSCGSSHTYYMKATDTSGNTVRVPSSTDKSFEVSCTTDQESSQSAYGSIRFLPGGIEAENYDKGGEGVSYHDTTDGNNGDVYRSDDVDLLDASSHYYGVSTADGEWLEYTVNVNKTDTYDIKTNIASDGSAGSLRLKTNGKTLGTYDIPDTGGSQSWQNISLKGVELTTGEQVLRLETIGSGFNINWIKICPCPEEDDQPPTAPTNLRVLNKDSSSVTFAWDPASDNEGVDHYRVYVDSTFYQNVSVTNATVDGLSSGKSYSLRVSAVDTSGNEGNLSGSLSVQPQTTKSVEQSPYVPLSAPGRIEAENFDKGGEGDAYYDKSSDNKGGEYRDTAVDIQTADDKSGKYNIGWIRDQEWLEYTVNFSSGTYDVKARVAAKEKGGKMRVKLDGETLGTYDIPETTGGWQSWQTITLQDVKVDKGQKVMRLEMIGGHFNINWMEFKETSVDTNAPEGDITHSPSSPSGQDEVTYTASATDDTGVENIEIFVDGGKVKRCSGGSLCTFKEGPYSCGSSHTYYMKATDTSGNTARSPSTGSKTLTVECDSNQSAYGSIRFLPGGIEAENYDKGGEGVSYHDTTSRNLGGSYRDGQVDVESATTHSYNIGYTEDGEWLEYTVNVNKTDTYDIKTNIASDGSAGSLRLKTNGKTLGTYDIPETTGGWQSWQNVTLKGVELSKGKQILRLEVIGGDFNINWIKACPCPDKDSQAPSAPSNLQLDSKTETSASLSWDAASDNEGVDHYNVYLNGSLKTQTSTTSATIDGLSSGTTYGVKVSAVDTSGNEGLTTSTLAFRTEGSSGTTTSGVVDDFEDGDISEYSGQLSYFQIRNSNTISGDHSLQAPDAGNGGDSGSWENGGYNTMASTSGLERYPEPGDTFSVDIRVDDKDTYGAVLWGVQRDTKFWPGYRLRIDTGASAGVEMEKIAAKSDSDIESHYIDKNDQSVDEGVSIVLSDRENGGFSDQFDGDGGNYNKPQPDVVYTCTITWKKNGKMPYRCEDQDGNLLAKDEDPKADTEFKDGGIGFMTTQSGSYVEGRGATWDNYRIINDSVDTTTDSDGDGISDSNDECPNSAEDFDGVEDSDGCPESDTSTQDMLAYWSLDGTSGEVNDETGNGYDGTNNGATRGVTGKSGNAFSFDGSNDYIGLGNMDVSGSEMTISAWFKADNLANCPNDDCRIISKATSVRNQDHWWMLSTADNSNGEPVLRFRLKTDESGDTTALHADSGVLSDNRWYHAVARYDGNQMELYLDGELVGSTSKTGGISTDSSVNVNIGRNPSDNRYWDGKIDEVKVFDRALNSTEISNLASAAS